MSSTNNSTEVFAWVSEPKYAKAVTEEHIKEFRTIVGSALAVERRTDGALVLYTSDEATRDRLDALMRFSDLFREQRIYVPKTS